LLKFWSRVAAAFGAIALVAVLLQAFDGRHGRSLFPSI